MWIFSESCKILPLMSVAVEIPVAVPGHGCFDVPLATSSNIILMLQQLLPECPWHGNKMLSCGLRQLQPDDIVEVSHNAVFNNYSEISNQETGWEGARVRRMQNSQGIDHQNGTSSNS